MQRRPYQNGYPDTLLCLKPGCPNVSSSLSMVEDKIMLGLSGLLDDLQIEQDMESPDEAQMESLQTARQSGEREIARLLNQMDSLHDLLEQGTYDRDTFLSRSAKLQTRLDAARISLDKIQSDIAALSDSLEKRLSFIPRIQHILSVYKTAGPVERCKMLKSVLQKITYLKTTPSHRSHDPSDFQLTLYPLFPLRHKH
jgi:hypothetical protein